MAKPFRGVINVDVTSPCRTGHIPFKCDLAAEARMAFMRD